MKQLSVKTWRRLLVGGFFVVLFAFLAVAVFFGMRVFDIGPDVYRSRDTAPYTDTLTEAEMAAWKDTKVKKGEAVVQMNLEIPVNGGENAKVRLINPPYSAYACEMTLQLVEETTPLYQSRRLNPGSVLLYAPLEGTLTEGSHEAVARYTFYDGAGNERGEYQLEVLLVCEEG